MKRCLHCGVRKAKARGLCEHCYENREIRAQYPTLYPGNYCAGGNEPTEEELDVLIAERLPTMPPAPKTGPDAHRQFTPDEQLARSAVWRRRLR